jgi:aldehyde:ferredoxin oxidoreductase
MGNIAGFAMECYEKGTLTEKETDELKLSWGSHEAIMGLINMVAYRKKIGDILAEGVKKASQRIGRGSEDIAQQTKGLESLAIPPMGWGLSFATSTRGFDHLRGLHAFEGMEFRKEKATELFGTSKAVDPYTIEGKPLLIKWHQELLAAVDSLETCKFYCAFLFAVGPEDLSQLFSAVKGLSINGKELLRIGERIYNLERLFNVREGISRKDDTLPRKLFSPIPSGPTKGFHCSRDNLSKMLDEYYELRGWSKGGIPTKKKKTELGFPQF